MDGGGSSGGEGCLRELLRDLRRSFLFPSRRVLANIGEPTLQFGSEISRFSSDLHRLASGFASHRTP